MAGLSLGIGLGLGFSTTQPPSQPTSEAFICSAIDNRRCISADRGNKAFVLAPHVIYWKSSRPDEFWLDAVVVSENGNAPNKPKLKSFEIADLEDIALSDAPFEPLTDFRPDDTDYAGKTRCVINLV